MTSQNPSFSVPARVLHWLMAMLIIAMLFVGAGMVSTVSARYPQLLALHRPLGIAILLLALIRLGVRVTHRPPPLPPGIPPLQATVAKLSHYLLYGLMIAMPLIGWAMQSAGGYPISMWKGVELFPILPHDIVVYGQLRRLHERRDRTVREPLRVGGPVIEDRCARRMQYVPHELCGEASLRVGSPYRAKDVVPTVIGELRKRRGIQHVGNMPVVQHTQLGQRSARAITACDCDDTRRNELCRRLRRSVGIAGIVLRHEFELPAKCAAGGIDLLDGEPAAIDDVDTRPLVAPGQRRRHTDLDRFLRLHITGRERERQYGPHREHDRRHTTRSD